MATKKTDIKKAILFRVRALYILLFGVGVAIAAKILYIQYGPQGEELRSQGTQITYERVTVEADRGDLLSWDGRILATSIPMYEVRMDFAAHGLIDSLFRRNVDSLAYSLAQFFGTPNKAAFKKKMMEAYANPQKNRYVLISPRRVNHLEIKEISSFPLFRLGQNRGGFIPRQINKRLLPYGPMAARTIGMINESGTKIGIEGAYDSILRGTEGSMMMQRISGSFRVPVPDELNVSPVDGIDVVTTLDVDVQDVAETALRKQLITGDADWGTAILMEVATGEIRAIANLTRQKNGQYAEDYNYAIAMNLEPGSTFKLATLMTLLEAGGASMSEMYDTRPGTQQIGKVKVVDTHNCGQANLEEIFAHSSNVGFALAVNRYFKDSPQKFVDHLRKMGLDQPLALPIAGEAAPVIRGPKDRWWDGTTLTMMSYGYAVRMTPLKTLSLYNAVANNGKMMRPMLVKEFRQYGRALQYFGPQVMVSSVGSAETIKQTQKALKEVVDDGTARMLQSPYYAVAAKTGTAQIAFGRGGYTDRHGGRNYLATVVGYFPADEPRYSCIVAIKTYNGPTRRSTYYGSALAGPVFKAIADRVYAQNTTWQKPVSKQLPKSEHKPELKPGRVEEMRRVAGKFSIPYQAPPRGSHWLGYDLADSLARRTVVITPQEGLVPNVMGMGIKEALYLLEKSAMVVSFFGVGQVVEQSLPAGSQVPQGELISLKLALRPKPEGAGVFSDE